MTSLLKKPEKDKIYVGVEKPLFHSASLSRNSQALNSISAKPFAKISRELAGRLSLADGDYVTISTAAGSLELPVMLFAGMPENIVFVPNNFEGAGAYNVLVWKINETIKTPAFDGIEVSLKKIERITAEVSA
jgi:NADH-quinone oxidoreductase subunit G